MDAAMDHNKPTFSTGHEVHICHRCGWPFPNPHPSSRHRRAHRKLCGTIEGYEIFEARSDDRQVSDDEHNSDGNERTPSPKVEKSNARELGSSDGVGGKSFKSDEDVFSDAISDFSDSGISPRLEERFDRVKGMDKIVEQEAVEVDLNGIELKKVDEASDQMEQLQIPTSSGQSCDLTGPESASDPSESILSVADTTEPVSGEGSNALQPNLTTSEIRGDVRIDSIGENGDKEIQQEMVEAGQDADTQREEDKLASVDLDLLDRQVTDPTAVSFEKEDVLCDNLVSEVVKHVASPQTETLENIDATTEAEGGATVVEVNEPTITAEDIAVVEETHKEILEVTDDSVSAKVVESTGSIEETTLAKESHSSMSSVKPGESTQSSPAIDSTATEYSDVVSAYPSLDKEVEQKTNLVGGEKTLNFDSNEGEKCDIAGSENESQELKETNSGDIVGADTSYAPENEENVLLKVENGGEEGAATGSEATLDSGLQSVNSTEVPGSCEGGSDTKHLEEASHIEPSLVESGDNAVQKSILELGGDTDTIRSVGSDGLGASLDHDSVDILDKSSLTTTMEDPVLLPVSSELPHNVHVTTDAKEVESVDVSEIESEPKHNGDIIAPERTPEHPISEETAPLFTNSETLREKSANEISSSSVDVRAPESVDVTETAIETEHGANVVVSTENSESPEVKMQEASPPDLECSKETSSHVDEERKSEDVTTSKSVDIAPGAEQTRDNHNSLLEKRTDAPSLNEPISFPVVVQVTEESSGAVNNVKVDSKSLQDEEKGQATKDNDGASATDLSGSCVSRSDSLEAKCGSVSDKSETHLQAPKTTTEEAFDPPSFMTLVQSDNKVDGQSSEIETVQNNQQPKTDALQAGWFPSLTNVVNESEGRKKNEEMIAKVTNWNPGKQHSPLKTLLNEAKSPKANQVPADINDNGAAVTTVSSVLAEEEATNKEAEKEWDSPARYPTEIKKEKKKKSKPYWVPFVCCSSVHRDL